MKKPTAIIIGAGYGGMALANILGRAGYRVDVYEKNLAPGGRISTVEKEGFLFDLGPSWYLMPEIFEQYYQLFEESANDSLKLLRFQPGYKVFFEKHPSLVIKGDVQADKNTFENIEKGAGKKLEKYVAKSSLAYNISTKYFLYNNHFRIRDLLRFSIIKNAPRLIRLTMNNLDNYVKKYFHDLRLKQLLEYHMVFLGSSPFQAPAIYTLMSHLDYKTGVFYPKNGMLSLVSDMQRIGQQFDIEYHYGRPVDRIIVKDGAASGVQLVDGKDIYADIVISNADLEFTESQLLSEESQSFPASYWEKRQPGPGAVLISLGIKGKLHNLLHHNLYFVENWRENFRDIYENKQIPDSASIYVCNPSKTDSSLAPENHENIFILMPIPADVEVSDIELDKITKKCIKILADITNVTNLSERIAVKHVFGPKDFKEKFNAWQFNAFGGESHVLSQSIRFRTPNKSHKVKNLYYVGAGTVPGIGLPMCLIGAQLTYKQIISSKKPGPLKASDL